MVPLLLYTALLLPAVQTQVVSYFTQQIASELHTDISIKRIHFRPFKSLVLEDFLIYDQQKDTLLHIEKINASIDSLRIQKRRIYFGTVKIETPKLNISKSDSSYNFSFLLNQPSTHDSIRENWKPGIRHILLEKGNVSYSDKMIKGAPNLSFNNVNVDITGIQNDSSFNISVKELQFEERTGFSLLQTKGEVTILKNQIQLSDFIAKTKNSNIHLDSLSVAINEKTGLPNTTSNFYLQLENSIISPKDIEYFVTLKRFSHVPITISGKLLGQLNNIKGRNVKLGFGPDSQVSASFDINGLPNINETFLYLDVKKLVTTPQDLHRLLALSDAQSLELPVTLQNLGYIHYKGNFTGFITDLVAFGNVTTPLGKISMDMGLKLDPAKKLIFSGGMSTNGFNVGKLLGAEKQIGHISMSASINGNRQSQSSFFAFLDGQIDSLSVNDYTYSDINLNGLFANQKFDGQFVLNDSNANVYFEGKIDFSSQVPNFNFQASLKNLKLDQLNLIKHIPESKFSVDLETNFNGIDLDDVIGYIKATNAKFTSPQASAQMDSLLLIAIRQEEGKHIILESDVLEGDLIGHYNFNHFATTLQSEILNFIPSLKYNLPASENTSRINDFSFSCRFKRVNEIVKLFIPELDISDNGIFMGKINSETHFIDIDGEFDHINYKGIQSESPEVYINTTANNQTLSVITRVKNLEVNTLGSFQNLSLHHYAKQDTVLFNIFWNNWDEFTNSGSIFTKTHLKSNKNGLYATINLEPSHVMFRDSLWELQPTSFHYHPLGFSVKNFRFHHGNQEIGINGFLHKEAKDGLKIHFQNIHLDELLKYQHIGNVSASGLLNGLVEVQNLFKTPIIDSDIKIKDFEFNKDTVGNFYLSSQYLPKLKTLEIESSVERNGQFPLKGGGNISLEQSLVDLDFEIDSLKIGFLNIYLKKIMQNLSGTASGQIGIKGPLTSPDLLGNLNVNDGHFDVNLLQTSYDVTDSVIFEKNKIIFKSLSLKDKYNNTGTFDGTIEHTAFRNMRYNLHLNTENMLALNTKGKDNPLYYGTVFVDGNLAVTGTTSDIIIDIAGKTMNNTSFFIPLKSEEKAEESNFIRFVSKDENQVKNEIAIAEDEYVADLTGMTITMEIDITPVAKTQVIFDSKIGDILKGNGNGNLQIKINKQGNINFFGDFSFEEGDYMFSLQNVINKRFLINQGSTINWDGNPYDANIDLNATYKLRTSLNNLVNFSGDNEVDNSEYTSRVPIHCNLLLTDRLMKPNIRFEIESPSLNNTTQDIIDAYIDTEEELNRQVLSLLVLNRFYTSDRQATQDGSAPGAGSNAAAVTSAEVLSNQLSHWLSQISNEFDIGVSYRPADQYTQEEVEVALSTQMFNNRVSINGNVGYGEDETRASNLIGDFDMDVKLNRSGNLRFKAYTHSNNDIIYETSPTTQGIGFSFKEEFDTLEELMHRYWLIITGQNKKEKKEKEEEETKD